MVDIDVLQQELSLVNIHKLQTNDILKQSKKPMGCDLYLIQVEKMIMEKVLLGTQITDL